MILKLIEAIIINFYSSDDMSNIYTSWKMLPYFKITLKSLYQLDHYVDIIHYLLEATDFHYFRYFAF